MKREGKPHPDEVNPDLRRILCAHFVEYINIITEQPLVTNQHTIRVFIEGVEAVACNVNPTEGNTLVLLDVAKKRGLTFDHIRKFKVARNNSPHSFHGPAEVIRRLDEVQWIEISLKLVSPTLPPSSAENPTPNAGQLTTKETEMSYVDASIPVQKVEFIYGRPVDHLSAQELIDAASAVKSEIAGLVKTNEGINSAKLAAKAEALKADLAYIVSLIDADVAPAAEAEVTAAE